MKCFISAIIGLFLGSIVNNCDTAIRLSNVMNASMLDCVTHKIITQEQVHDIEDVFIKHIEENFKHIKASHGDK